MTTFIDKVGRTTARTTIPFSQPKGAKETLVEIVLTAVADVDWGQPGFQGRLDRMRTARGEAMLATLTYCYALKMYSSALIETEIHQNRKNVELLDRINIDRRLLAQFRRYNRDLIKVCLTQVLGELGGPFVPEVEAEDRIENAVACDFLEDEE
jgi:hypothetical protein